MIPKRESTEYVEGYTIRIKFTDGVETEIDLETELWGEVFEPLKDLGVFRKFELDKELNTVTWPSGADFAPEFLYERAVQQAAAADAASRRR